MGDTFCPRCGRERTGSFRFCRDCGFDFDDAVMALEPDPERAVATQTLWVPPPTTPAAERPKQPARLGRYVAVAVVGLLGIGAFANLTNENTRRAYRNDVGSFLRFIGIKSARVTVLLVL